MFLRLWTSLPRPVRLLFWRALCCLGRRIYGRTELRCQRLPFGLWAKFPSDGPGELAVMQFVAANTSVPIPKVIDFIPRTAGLGEDYLIMSHIRGHHPPLLEYSDAQRRSLARQLRACIDQLRQLPAPGSQICAFGGGKCNSMLRLGWDPCGPFLNLDAFNAYIRSLVPPHIREHPTVVASQARRHRIVFTHNDLVARNVLVDSTGHLVGILDWERAGWFPEYWEYTTALQEDIFRAWIDLVYNIFEEYDLERQAESILSTNVTHI